jgi:hypothetical protein
LEVLLRVLLWVRRFHLWHLDAGIISGVGCRTRESGRSSIGIGTSTAKVIPLKATILASLQERSDGPSEGDNVQDPVFVNTSGMIMFSMFAYSRRKDVPDKGTKASNGSHYILAALEKNDRALEYFASPVACLTVDEVAIVVTPINFDMVNELGAFRSHG